MAELFTFESLSMLAEPPPSKLTTTDARWSLEASRRTSSLFAEKRDSDPAWYLKAAELAFDTARHDESQALLLQVLAEVGEGQDRLLARTWLFRNLNYLEVVDGPNAELCLQTLQRLASESSDRYLIGVYQLAKGLNLQYSSIYVHERHLEKGASLARPYFEKAVDILVELGEIDLAIRAQLELARATFELGNFFSGIERLETAYRMARDGDSWKLFGRIILLFASNASDMGYRIGVKRVIHLALEWCEFVGDLWGHAEALTVMGRFLYYSMPVGEAEPAAEADHYLQLAIEEAEERGMSRIKATVDSTRFFLYRKAGDDAKLQAMLGDTLEVEEFRQKQALDNRIEIERIADERRRKTALRLHDGVEESLDAFFVFDAFRNSEGRCRDFGWVYMNRAANRICNQSGGQVYLYSEARHFPQMMGLDEAMLCAVNDRKAFEDTTKIESLDDDLWLQRRVLPSGEGVLVTLRDVTAEKRIELVLREAAESARQSESAKSAFLASMSHEIRTPLNGVLGLTRMLAETELNAMQRNYLEKIILSGDILLDLIGDVLDLSKIEAREMHLTPAPVSLPSLVASVVNLVHSQAYERGIDLQFQIDTDVPETFFADGTRLRQILSNLVGNAVKFTDGGSVRLDVSTMSGQVVFRVTDTGIGIESDQINIIFDRFKQVKNSSRGGTGLGLAIARALAEMMGGKLTAESVRGCGSTFTLSLPLEEVQPLDAKPAHLASKRFSGCQALVVDDNSINLLVSSHAIEKLGCETHCASGGLEALDILANSKFDIVFLDVQMPGLDGLEVTRELRRREAGGIRTPVVALTAGALLQEHDACLAAGMDDFITKPITLESIQNVLGKWLPR